MGTAPRIHLIGGSGAGKSTVGQAISRATGLPFTDLDELYWEPGWREVGHAELWRRLQPRLDTDGWVVAGNYGATTERHVWPRATHVVVLDLPLSLMLWRAGLRTLRRCLTGEPCCNGNRESFGRIMRHDAVVPYLLRTWHRRHRRYAGLADEPALAHARVLRLRNRADVDRLVRALPAPFT